MSRTSPDARTRALAERRPGDPTRLADVVNFGPVTLPEFAAVGITTVDQIERLGAEETCRRYVERFPERLNVNALVGVVATLEGVPWTRVSPGGKALARRIADDLAAHFGRAPAPKKKRR
ncbi:MAG: TfoX/Sxy family DNA transformation protein [Polyangiales bacterium]